MSDLHCFSFVYYFIYISSVVCSYMHARERERERERGKVRWLLLLLILQWLCNKETNSNEITNDLDRIDRYVQYRWNRLCIANGHFLSTWSSMPSIVRQAQHIETMTFRLVFSTVRHIFFDELRWILTAAVMIIRTTKCYRNIYQ
jgi:hypothetical protein